jgi:ABC-type dipeptide/oligopeptide/nickel transport system ATPase component
MRQVRGREIALVLQSAATSLNPALKIVTQFQEAWRAHSKEKWAIGRERTLALLSDVNLPPTDEFLGRYPRQVSLGQAQRVLIALSLLHRPDLIIADEPTSALDTITQREVLELLSRLRVEHGMATLFISHDLLSVGAFCHRVAILKDGKIVEEGETAQIFSSPQHEYTQRLIDALPALPALEPASKQREDEDVYDPSLANLAKHAQAESNGKLIPFPGSGSVMLNLSAHDGREQPVRSNSEPPPCAEASKPSADRSLPLQTKR